VIFTTEKLLKESGEKMKPEDKKELEDKTAALKAVKDGENYEEMKKVMEELNQVAQRIGTAMYQAQEANKPKEEGAQPEGEKPAEDNVVEGEVEPGEKK